MENQYGGQSGIIFSELMKYFVEISVLHHAILLLLHLIYYTRK